MFHHSINFYLAVGLLTQSKTSALANKNIHHPAVVSYSLRLGLWTTVYLLIKIVTSNFGLKYSLPSPGEYLSLRQHAFRKFKKKVKHPS